MENTRLRDARIGGLVRRRATLDDVPELVRLRQIIFQGHPAEQHRSWLEPCARYFRDRIVRDETSFCAMVISEQPVGGPLAACAVGWIDNHLPSPVSESGALGYVGSVTTDPLYQGMGLGSEVFSSLMGWFTEHDVPRVELQTTPDAAALYRKFGFADLPTPVLRWYQPSKQDAEETS